MFMFLYNLPDCDLHWKSKLVAIHSVITKSFLWVIGNIDMHYECYVNGDVPYEAY
jgi:hypothetical protein